MSGQKLRIDNVVYIFGRAVTTRDGARNFLCQIRLTLDPVVDAIERRVRLRLVNIETSAQLIRLLDREVPDVDRKPVLE